MVITAITIQKKNKQRVSVFLDQKFAFSLELEVVLRHHLKVNQTLTQDVMTQLIKEHDFAHWYNAALKLISIRPRAQKEITDYFKKHEVGEQTQIQVLTKLIDRKFIDDAAFARWFVEQRQTFRPKSARVIMWELKQKGVPTALAQQASAGSGVSEYETAISLITKKLPRWGKLPKQQQKQKIHSFLATRGFGWEVISQIFKELPLSQDN